MIFVLDKDKTFPRNTSYPMDTLLKVSCVKDFLYITRLNTPKDFLSGGRLIFFLISLRKRQMFPVLL